MRKCTFVPILRQTRSAIKSSTQPAPDNKLNISYSTIIVDDDADGRLIKHDEVVMDLRNKLVQVQNSNKECEQKIMDLEAIIKEKNSTIEFLDKKVRSRMLPLHAADVQQFIDSVEPNIESHKEFTDFSNKLDNFSGPKIYYHTECRVDFNNELFSLKATPSKTEWHYHREYHQTVFD